MKSFFLALLSILMAGCNVLHHDHVVNDKFVEYINDNKMGMKLDFESIDDKDFRLQIPKGMESKDITVGGSFLHVLTFNENQKIVILYLPKKKTSIDEQSFILPYKALNLSYRQFEKVCDNKEIFDYLEDIPMLRHRRFGINKLNVRGFYVFYLNIKRDKVDTFNYSINSIHL